MPDFRAGASRCACIIPGRPARALYRRRPPPLNDRPPPPYEPRPEEYEDARALPDCRLLASRFRLSRVASEVFGVAPPVGLVQFPFESRLYTFPS